MIQRKKTPPNVETEILKKCRRRCAFCFGLHQDTSIKEGQIAHLDKNPSNYNIDNLAFLCLKHHNQYDSTTSQSKNLTMLEAKEYRKELELWITEFQAQNTEQPKTIAPFSDLESCYEEKRKILKEGLLDNDYHILIVNRKDGFHIITHKETLNPSPKGERADRYEKAAEDLIKSRLLKRVETEEDTYKLTPQGRQAARKISLEDQATTSSSKRKDELKKEIFTEPSDWARLNKIGGWNYDSHSRTIQGKGKQRYILSHFEYGQRPFRITSRLKFTSLMPSNDIAAVNAGIIFGWRQQKNTKRYLNFMFTGTKLVLEVIGDNGGPETSDYKHIGEEVPFRLVSGRYYMLELSVKNNDLAARIDGEEMFNTTIPTKVDGWVGIRPWRSRIEIDQFEIEEE